jgi:hypothetical protein
LEKRKNFFFTYARAYERITIGKGGWDGKFKLIFEGTFSVNKLTNLL